MAEVTPQQDGGAQITIDPAETAGLKALAAQHLPILRRLSTWFEADVAPELKQAADFLESLGANPPEGSTLTVSPSQVQTLRGLLGAHVGEFQQVLAVVESSAVRSLLTFAQALL
jgi:hypothetical protein